MKPSASADQVLRYHEETKHSAYRSARSLGYLDWGTQPDPFRSFQCAEQIPLPLVETDRDAGHMDLYERSRNPFHPFDLRNVAAFMELSMGLSAWKSYQSNRWPLRINPSSGNLHPTECYLLLPTIESLSAGVFHYHPYHHALERRANLSEHHWTLLNHNVPTEGFLVALTSVFWREEWKYGERAFRYCQHDVGHALAALSFSANLLGWSVTFLQGAVDRDIERMLGFEKTIWPTSEREVSELVCRVHPTGKRSSSLPLSSEFFEAFNKLEFFGTPNQLSPEHVDWEIIQIVAAATQQIAVEKTITPVQSVPFIQDGESSFSAMEIIRQRRSFVACDKERSITKAQFFAILDKTLPRRSSAPFDVGFGEAYVNLFVFVHRVTDLSSGLYFFIRNEAHLNDLRRESHQQFLWRKADERHPLYLLKTGDYRHEAMHVSCGQAIASDGAFSLGMIAKFREPVECNPHMYRRLFWESGMIGQVLYLEAEAQGVRGTGIGCFFDDAVHEIIGLKGGGYQSLYHFTVGGPLDDSRLETSPPYGHLK